MFVYYTNEWYFIQMYSITIQMNSAKPTRTRYEVAGFAIVVYYIFFHLFIIKEDSGL